MVGVVLKSKFVFSSQEKFSEYITYINRSEAVRNAYFDKYSAYVGGYMDNPEKQQDITFLSQKTSALFTRTKDNLSLPEKKLLQEQFSLAQKNGSPMWQNVISFDNRFLKEHGLYDPATGMLDEDKMRSVTRAAMEKMLQQEAMQESAVWSASIHFNTKNIHVHIAAVEPMPTREKKDFTYYRKDGTSYTRTQYRAKLKPGTLDRMKSSVVNQIVDRSQDLKLMNDLIRKNFSAGRKSFVAQRAFRDQILQIRALLPDDRRQWHYNMSSMSKARPKIDALTDSLTQKYCPQEFAEFKEKLAHEQGFLKTAYGAGKNERFTNYQENKLQEWYERKGNMILKELKAYDKTCKEKQRARTAKGRLRALKSTSGRNPMQQLRRALEKDFKAKRNLQLHENLLRNIDNQLEHPGLDI